MNKTLGLEDYAIYIREFFENQFLKEHLCFDDYEDIITSYDTWCSFILLYFNIVEKPYSLLQVTTEQIDDNGYRHVQYNPGDDFFALMNHYGPWSLNAKMADM